MFPRNKVRHLFVKQNDLPDTGRSQLIEKGFGMFETSLWHVSGLTRPRLYAVGRADSGLLFPQLF